jgi:phosphoglycolate phosphatase-like HAD superfamily hydrolase
MKAIIFDFDGVILDSVNVKTKAFELLYKDYGPDVQDKVVKYHLDHGGISRFEKFKYYHKKFLNIELSEQELDLLGEKFSSLVFDKVCSSNYIPGAYQFLQFCSKKYLTFICTGTPYSEIIKVLSYKKLDEYFDHIYGSPMTKTQIIIEIQKKYGLYKNDILFIGDAMTDFNASNETNINFIGVKNNETQFPKNTIEVEDLMQIIKIKNL